jgi:hypothetical protein
MSGNGNNNINFDMFERDDAPHGDIQAEPVLYAPRNHPGPPPTRNARTGQMIPPAQQHLPQQSQAYARQQQQQSPQPMRLQAPPPQLPPGGRTVQHAGELPGAKKIEATYENRAAEAAAIKRQAMSFIADAIKSGDYELPLTEDERQQLAADRIEARKYQTQNAPHGVVPTSTSQSAGAGAAGGRQGPARKSITAQEKVTIPNYNVALDYSCVPRNQCYALISYMGPRNCNPISDEYAFRIWGVFATRADADSYVQHIRAVNRYSAFYDILVMDLTQSGWSPFPPILDEIEQERFQNEHLQDFHDSHLEQQRKAQQHYQSRIDDAHDINPEIERERKLRAEAAKLQEIMQRKAATSGRSVDQVLGQSGTAKSVSIGTSLGTVPVTGADPGERVEFEHRKNPDGTISTIKKTIRRKNRK